MTQPIIGTQYTNPFASMEPMLWSLFWQAGKWILVCGLVVLAIGMVVGLFTNGDSKRFGRSVAESPFEHFLEAFFSLGVLLTGLLIDIYRSKRAEGSSEKVGGGSAAPADGGSPLPEQPDADRRQDASTSLIRKKKRGKNAGKWLDGKIWSVLGQIFVAVVSGLIVFWLTGGAKKSDGASAPGLRSNISDMTTKAGVGAGSANIVDESPAVGQSLYGTVQTISRGDTYVDRDKTGLIIGLLAISHTYGDGESTAKINLTLPVQNSVIVDDVVAGKYWDFYFGGRKYRLLIETIDWASGFIRISIDEK